MTKNGKALSTVPTQPKAPVVPATPPAQPEAGSAEGTTYEYIGRLSFENVLLRTENVKLAAQLKAANETIAKLTGQA